MDEKRFAVNNDIYEQEKKLEEKEIQVQKLRDQTVNLDKKVELLKSHEKQALQTIEYNQILQNAVKQEIDSEASLMKIIDTERSYILSQMKKYKAQTQLIDQQITSTRRYLASKAKQLQDLESTLTWESDICQAWLKTSISNEENNLSIMTMKSDDKSTIKDLENKLQKISLSVEKWNIVAGRSTNEQNLLQVDLKRSSEDFSTNLSERDELVKLWEQCIREMEKQDRNILLLGKELEKTLNEITEIKSQLSHHEQLLRDEKNRESRTKQNLFDINAVIPNLLQSLQNYGKDSGHEKQLEALKTQVRNAALDEISVRTEIKMLQMQLENKNSDFSLFFALVYLHVFYSFLIS